MCGVCFAEVFSVGALHWLELDAASAKMLTFEERCIESAKVRARHRNSGPVIVQPHDSKTPMIDRCKYLVPWELTYGQFLYVVRKRVGLTKEQSLFMFCDNSLPMQQETIRDLHRKYGDQDGFLYFTYALENTFG